MPIRKKDIDLYLKELQEEEIFYEDIDDFYRTQERNRKEMEFLDEY